MNLNNLTPIFIVGAGRSGTTTLFDFIGQFDQVCKCKYKEPCFFDRNYEFGINWYFKLFNIKKNHRFFLEASTNTMWYPGSFKKIISQFPNAKIIYSLRNPGERCFADYKRMIEKNGEKRKFLDIFENTNLFKKRSNYTESLQECYKYINQKNILILNFEEWINDDVNLIKNLSKFLNLNINLNSIKIIKKNQSRPPIFYNLQHFRTKYLFNNYKDPKIIFFIKAFLRHLIEYFNHLPSANQFPNITKYEKNVLKKYYKSDILKLKKKYHLNIKSWINWYEK